MLILYFIEIPRSEILPKDDVCKKHSYPKKIIQKDTVFKDQKDFLEDKINELKQKMVLCNIILNKPFVASKTADITLNFITSLHEIEFKRIPDIDGE